MKSLSTMFFLFGLRRTGVSIVRQFATQAYVLRGSLHKFRSSARVPLIKDDMCELWLSQVDDFASIRGYEVRQLFEPVVAEMHENHNSHDQRPDGTYDLLMAASCFDLIGMSFSRALSGVSK